METIISAILKIGTVTALTGGMLATYAEAIEYVCPQLRAAVAYQEQTIKTAEALGSGCAQAARAEWTPKKADALAKITALENSAKNLKDGINTLLGIDL